MYLGIASRGQNTQKKMSKMNNIRCARCGEDAGKYSQLGRDYEFQCLNCGLYHSNKETHDYGIICGRMPYKEQILIVAEPDEGIDRQEDIENIGREYVAANKQQLYWARTHIYADGELHINYIYTPGILHYMAVIIRCLWGRIRGGIEKMQEKIMRRNYGKETQ